MAQRPIVPATEAGLDSLLAYAQPAASGAQAGPQARPNLWKWVVLRSMGVLATVLLIVVSTRVAQETRLASLRSVAEPKAVPPSLLPQAESAAPKSVESPRQKDAVAKAQSKAQTESELLLPGSLRAGPQAPRPRENAVI